MYIKRYITLCALLLVMLFAKKTVAQTPGFGQTDVPKVSGITTDSALYALPLAQRQTAKVYYDGLGRTIQAIAVEASPTEKDIIQPVAYDNLGRQTTGYLPYGGSTGDVMGSYRPNALTTGAGQAAFYNQTSQYLIPVDTAPRSQRVFENSPLQRVLDAGMPGGGFQPLGSGTQHYKKVNYRPDSTTDGSILLWYTNGTYSGTSYASKTLSVTDATDEDNVEILTFTDKMGHLIMKRQKSGSTFYDTYYIYNNAGMVSYVIPPLAVSKLATNSYSLTAAAIAPLLFHYTYNSHGQPTQRIIPGKGVMYIVYDPLNRPVLMQDSNMRVNHQWNYIKYDAKARVISQGIYTDNTRTTLSAMQTYVSGLAYTTWYEIRNLASATMYYTNTVFPTVNIAPLAYAYFDDYNMTGHTLPTFSYVAQHDGSLPNEESPTTARVKGMPTMVTKTTVGAGLSGIWLTSVVFYDHNLHAIQQQSNNQLNYTTDTTLTDAKTTVYDFTGMPLYSKVTKRRTSTDTVSVYIAITYDQVYRIKQINQKYNNGANNPVAAYSYNELGQLILKNIGYVSPTTWLQNEDFRYNIRGWLLSINNSKLTSDGGITNSDNNDLFGMQLMYDKADSALSDTKRFNGKPSGIKWMTRNYSNTRTMERSYLFSYNNFNHYLGETYAERDSTSTGTNPFNLNVGAFNETHINYDADGNITTLSRYAIIPGGGISQIDTLAYFYNANNGNQLTKVTDGTDAAHMGFGFRNVTGSSTLYTYDGNGNLTADAFKNITKITYDVLNRTDTIKISSSQYIIYTYDADGGLLRKRVYASSTLQTTTDYIDGFVYLTAGTGTPALSYFPMPEGRVLDSAGTFTQEFILTDQQGNARVAFRNVGNVARVFQENSYYGTGLILPNSPVSTPTVANKKLYNGGSEWQNDSALSGYNLPDYYETANRNYDPTIGRFISVDPMAESAEVLTSYQYAGDNPIIANDPSGALLDWSKRNMVQPITSGESGYAGLMQEVGEADALAAQADDPANYSTWNGYDFGGPGAESNGVNIYHAGDGTANDPSTGLSIQTLGVILKAFSNSTSSSVTENANGNGVTLNVIVGNAGGSVAPGLFYGYKVGTGTDDAGNAVVGAIFEIGYVAPANAHNFVSYNFIQTASTWPAKILNGQPLDNPFIDNGKNDPNNPLYYNAFELITHTNIQGTRTLATIIFEDVPYTENSNYWFSAEATLVGVRSNGQIVPLGSISWGYAADNGNAVSGAYSISFSWLPSSTQQAIIHNYNNNHQ